MLAFASMTVFVFSFPRSSDVSFPRSSVGMHTTLTEAWIPTEDHGNQSTLTLVILAKLALESFSPGASIQSIL